MEEDPGGSSVKVAVWHASCCKCLYSAFVLLQWDQGVFWQTNHALWIPIFWIVCYSCVNDDEQIMRKFCTCHNSFAVMTCAKLLPDWVIRIEIWPISIHTRFLLWAHKLRFWNGSRKKTAHGGSWWCPILHICNIGYSCKETQIMYIFVLKIWPLAFAQEERYKGSRPDDVCL